MPSLHDFNLHDAGSIAVLQPVTAAAQDWVEEHIPSDAISWGRGIVIEPRYLDDILDGIAADGLTWEN